MELANDLLLFRASALALAARHIAIGEAECGEASLVAAGAAELLLGHKPAVALAAMEPAVAEWLKSVPESVLWRIVSVPVGSCSELNELKAAVSRPALKGVA
jgi:hypothetical protein